MTTWGMLWAVSLKKQRGRQRERWKPKSRGIRGTVTKTILPRTFQSLCEPAGNHEHLCFHSHCSSSNVPSSNLTLFPFKILRCIEAKEWTKTEKDTFLFMCLSPFPLYFLYYIKLQTEICLFQDEYIVSPKSIKSNDALIIKPSSSGLYVILIDEP